VALLWIAPLHAAEALSTDAVELDRAIVVFDPHREAILSAQVSERVVSISHDLGESFEREAALIELDREVFRQRLTRAQAELKVAVANLEAAERLHEQQGALKRARAQLELARAQRDVVQKMIREHIEVRKAEAILDVAKANLEATEKLYEDNAVSSLELANARKDLVVARANLDRAEASEDTERVRAEKEVVSARAKLEEVQASLQPKVEKARSDAAVARANVALAENEFDASRIRAPFAGRVERVFVREGELVQRGQQLLTIYNEDILLARFLVPSRLHGEVELGMEVSLEVFETDVTVSGTIDRMGKIDTVSESFEVFAEVRNAEGLLRAGMQGTIDLDQFEETAP
jgi:multidrug efflux pump subunit AcrA (membrane-fusion protein)